MYRRALDEGLYPSLRQMCADLDVDPGNASKAIAIARLPIEILAAFESPTQIQFRWGKDLTAVLQKDPDSVIERAKTMRFGAKHLPPTEALNRLLGNAKPTKPVTLDLKQKGRVVGKLTRKSDGAISLSLHGGALDEAEYAALQSVVEGLLIKNRGVVRYNTPQKFSQSQTMPFSLPNQRARFCRISLIQKGFS